MSEDRFRELLDDMLDGELEPDLMSEAAAHLEGCADCRRELDQLRSLRSATNRLPRSIEPPRDLWPGVAGRLDSRTVQRRRFLRPRYAVAAVALLAVALSLTQVRTKRAGERTTPAAAVQDQTSPAFVSLTDQWRRTEAVYESAAAELLEALDEVRDELPSGTVDRFEANLKIVDDAIRESRQALEADPGNLEVLQLLAAVHEKRLDLLKRTARVERI